MDLPLHEVSAKSWNAIDRLLSILEIMPGKARPHCRHVEDPPCGTIACIVGNDIRVEIVKAADISIATNTPWVDGIHYCVSVLGR